MQEYGSLDTEETIKKMKGSEYPIKYLIGTPKGRLTKLEKKFLDKPWEEVRDKVKVKLLKEACPSLVKARDGELYVLVESADRVNKERSMRRHKLKRLWARLKQLQAQSNTRDQLLLKIGAAKKEAGRVYPLVKINLPDAKGIVNKETFTFSLNKDKFCKVMKKEGKYLLRSNLTATDPGLLWKQYMLLGEIEQAFKEIKGDLLIRPIHHQKDIRIEAHIFVAFQAYCLNVTLKQRLKLLAPGLTPRAVIEKFKKIQMLDVHLPTTDGKQLVLTRYTQPEREHKMLLNQMKLNLPKQPPPKITSNGETIVK
ncbi:MAG: transposase IS4 family protein [Candidatus Scalindua rubra]|uniref:Transposase IS4 family protein n=1 Tax=Candidatus Scalindua rubra TaxID=1872076 RepID=A0A1E3XGG1_9BACT|nr:MAG: transposase IS4 family protein [Candidatus Scalindua rubra]